MPAGPHGIPFEKAAHDFHITFMIANDQPRYQPMDRIAASGLACGYRFRILTFEASASRSRVTVTNAGVAPIYHDAYLAGRRRPRRAVAQGAVPGRITDRRDPGRRDLAQVDDRQRPPRAGTIDRVRGESPRGAAIGDEALIETSSSIRLFKEDIARPIASVRYRDRQPESCHGPDRLE